MIRLPLILLFATLTLPLSCQTGSAQTTDHNAQFGTLEPSLLQAIHDYDAAQVHGNRAELERLVAPDYLIVRPRGVGDRASLVDGMTAPGMRLDPFTVLKPFTRNFGQTVVTGGWVSLQGTDGGKAFTEKFRFSDTWSKRGGRWYVVMTQLTPAEAP